MARFGAVSSTGDPEGEIVDTGVVPDGRSDAARPGAIRQRPPAYSAVKVGGRRAYALARAGVDGRAARARGRGRTASRSCWRDGERRGVRDRVLVGHLRAQPDRRPRRRLLRGAAADRGSARFEVADADPERLVPLDDALAFLPAVRLDARRGPAGAATASPVAGRRRPAGRSVRLDSTPTGADRARRAGARAGTLSRSSASAGAVRGCASAPTVGFRADGGHEARRRRARARGGSRWASSTASTSATAR